MGSVHGKKFVAYPSETPTFASALVITHQNRSMAATTTHPALEDFVEFLAKLAPRKVLEFKASPQAQERLFVLLQKTKKCRLILKKPKKWSITDDSAFG